MVCMLCMIVHCATKKTAYKATFSLCAGDLLRFRVAQIATVYAVYAVYKYTLDNRFSGCYTVYKLKIHTKNTENTQPNTEKALCKIYKRQKTAKKGVWSGKLITNRKS